MSVNTASSGGNDLQPNLRDIGENKTVFQAFADETGYDSDAHTRLFLGELGFGKEVYDPRAAAGLNTYMRVNGYDEEVDHAVLAGGLFPEFPFLYSKNNAERMRYLATDPRRDGVPDSERLDVEFIEAIADEDHAEHYQEFIDKWLEGKITTWEMVKSYSRWQLETLFDGVDVDRIDYCQGDEDAFNRKEKEEVLVNKLSKEAKKYRDNLQEEKEEAEKEKERHEEELETLEKEYSAIKQINQRVANHRRANEPDVGAFIDNRVLDTYEIFKEMTGEERKDLEELLNNVDDGDDFDELYAQIEGSYKDERKTVQSLEDEIDSYDERIGAVERQIEQGDAVTAFIRRSYLEPHEAEWLYKRTKDEYTDDIFDVFPEELEDNVHPHISRWAHVEDLTYTVETEDGEETVFDLEEADVGLYGDMMVMHNTKFRSDTPTLKGLQEAEQELLYRRLMNRVTNGERNELPRLIVSSHPAGGFSYRRINTSSEFRELTGAERETPVISTSMTLPTFHSTEKLLDFKDKGIKNQDTKRTDKHMHQEGAVFQTVLDDGSEIHFHIPTSDLIEIGEKQQELQTHEEGSAAYRELEREIEQMCAIYPKIRMVISDPHWGAANWPGMPATHQRTTRPKNYLEATYGQADFENKQLVFTGDMLNGDLSFTGDTYKNYADTVPELREDLKEQIQELNAQAEDGALDLDEMNTALGDTIDLLSESIEGMPFTHRNKQLDMASVYVPQFVDAADPIEIVIASGDHDAKSGKDSNTDEAKDIEERLPDSFDGNVIVSDSIGSKHGAYGGIKDETIMIDGEEFSTGRTILYHHRIPAGKTSDVRTKRKMIRSGYLPDEYIAGHVHHGRGAMYNGIEETIGHPLKAQDDYGEHLSVNSPLYGTIIKWSNAAPEGHPANGVRWAAWHDVVDNTLEGDEFLGDDLDEELERLEHNVNALA